MRVSGSLWTAPAGEAQQPISTASKALQGHHWVLELTHRSLCFLKVFLNILDRKMLRTCMPAYTSQSRGSSLPGEAPSSLFHSCRHGSFSWRLEKHLSCTLIVPLTLPWIPTWWLLSAFAKVPEGIPNRWAALDVTFTELCILVSLKFHFDSSIIDEFIV